MKRTLSSLTVGAVLMAGVMAHAEDRKAVIAERADQAKDRVEAKADRDKDRIDHNAKVSKDKVEHDSEVAKDRIQHNADVSRGAASDRPLVHESAPVRKEVSDTWITTKIKAKFVGEDKLDGSDIRVDSDKDGLVTLRGSVASEAGRQRALDIAKTTDGVRKVDDQLKIHAKR